MFFDVGILIFYVYGKKLFNFFMNIMFIAKYMCVDSDYKNVTYIYIYSFVFNNSTGKQFLLSQAFTNFHNLRRQGEVY